MDSSAGPADVRPAGAAVGFQDLDHHLQAVRRQHPSAEIVWDEQTRHWGAIEHSPGGGEIFTHAPTLAELDIKLGAESSEAG